MCPGPIIKVADTLKDLRNGQRVYVEATEDAFESDIQIWAERTGNKLESLDIENGIIKAVIQKVDRPETDEKNDKTFVVFSGDLDKTIAAFIIVYFLKFFTLMLFVGFDFQMLSLGCCLYIGIFLYIYCIILKEIFGFFKKKNKLESIFSWLMLLIKV